MNDESQNPSDNLTSDLSQFDQHKGDDHAVFHDLTVGTGDEAAVGRAATVNYRGWLTDGTVFDESYSRGQAFTFTPGEHRVITGWEEGVIGMKVGGKRRLVVPPAVGYGDRSTGPIPAGSVLIFDIELLEVR